MGDTILYVFFNQLSMPKKEIKKANIKKALTAAKALEKIPMPSAKELAALHKEGLKHVQELQKLLKAEWFVSDKDRAGKRLKRK